MCYPVTLFAGHLIVHHTPPCDCPNRQPAGTIDSAYHQGYAEAYRAAATMITAHIAKHERAARAAWARLTLEPQRAYIIGCADGYRDSLRSRHT
jgi:hypothetical protein